MFTDFEFHGEKASDYGLIVGSFQGTNGTETVSSGADISFQQVKPSGSNTFQLFHSTYENAYTTTFQIIKNPRIYKTKKDMFFTISEVTSIQRWLCKKDGYHKFKIDDDAYQNIYWKGTFSSQQINLNGGIVGLELTLTTDAPYAYLDKIVIDVDCSSTEAANPASFHIYDMSDEEGYLYPDMEIFLLESGDFFLKNDLDNDAHIMKICHCTNGEIIKIDGTNQIISTSLESHEISRDFNYLFPRIINTYTENKNSFTCNLKCRIILSYSPIRKIGI